MQEILPRLQIAVQSSPPYRLPSRVIRSLSFVPSYPFEIHRISFRGATYINAPGIKVKSSAE